MKRILLVFLVLVLVPASALAKRDHPEKHYQNQWCQEQGGQAEVVLSDRTRCDCLTTTHAVEVDFANKWAESIGQSLHYSIKTGRRAGVVLILEKPKDMRYWIRLNDIIQHYDLPIDCWQVGGGAGK